MDIERVCYLGVILSPSGSLKDFPEALNRSFSQPVHDGKFVSVLLQISQNDAGHPVFDLKDCKRLVAGISFMEKWPEAYTVLNNWLQKHDQAQLQEAVVFVASHIDLVDQVKKVCRLSGFTLDNSYCLQKRKAAIPKEAKKELPGEVLAHQEALATMTNEMQRLVNEARIAMMNGQTDKVKEALPKIKRLRIASTAKSELLPILTITT